MHHGVQGRLYFLKNSMVYGGCVHHRAVIRTTKARCILMKHQQCRKCLHTEQHIKNTRMCGSESAREGKNQEDLSGSEMDLRELSFFTRGGRLSVMAGRQLGQSSATVGTDTGGPSHSRSEPQQVRTTIGLSHRRSGHRRSKPQEARAIGGPDTEGPNHRTQEVPNCFSLLLVVKQLARKYKIIFTVGLGGHNRYLVTLHVRFTQEVNFRTRNGPPGFQPTQYMQYDQEYDIFIMQIPVIY